MAQDFVKQAKGQQPSPTTVAMHVAKALQTSSPGKPIFIADAKGPVKPLQLVDNASWFHAGRKPIFTPEVFGGIIFLRTLMGFSGKVNHEIIFLLT